MISLLSDKFVISENLERCGLMPVRSSVIDELRSSLFKFIEVSASGVRDSRDRAEF